jgi:hypothetical protein
MTLAGAPDWTLIFWQWDQYKVLSKIALGVDPAADMSLDHHWQVSFNYFQSELFAAVTGPDKYMYIACEENFLN